MAIGSSIRLPLRDFTMIDDAPINDAATGTQIGVEVKTSWLDIIFLNRRQVAFDVAVANGSSVRHAELEPSK